MTSKTMMSLKLLVDKNSKKVLFAEAGKDLVDLLVGLLGLPLGSFMALLVDQGVVGSGSFGKIHESLQKFYPSSSHGPNQNMDSQSNSYGSSEEVTYMVMDDLTVKPMSSMSTFTLLNNFGVKDVGSLREKTVEIGTKKVLELLKASFQSNTVFTDVFLGDWLLINWEKDFSRVTMLSKKVTLKSIDGEAFEVDKAVALQSQTIKHVIEDGCADSDIPLPNLTSEILAKVIEYCKKHVEAVPKIDRDDRSAEGEDLKAWDAEFVKVDQKTLFDLILAANYLDIKNLLDLTCQTVADMIKGKTPAEICSTFNIRNEFTPEEEEEVRRENRWAFE